jgi:hypothetical protein
LAYPAADIPVELARATQWLKANPKKAKKSNWRKWLTTSWLNNCQDRGGTHRERGVKPDGRRSAADAAAEWKRAAEDPEVAKRRAEFIARSAGTTDQQRAVLDALSRLSAAKGYAPTVREIADDLAVNVNDVMQKLWRLRRDGVVDWEDGRCRTLRIVEVVA